MFTKNNVVLKVDMELRANMPRATEIPPESVIGGRSSEQNGRLRKPVCCAGKLASRKVFSLGEKLPGPRFLAPYDKHAGTTVERLLTVVGRGSNISFCRC